MSYLSHPGVTPIYDRGACRDGRPYYVMKLIDGVTPTVARCSTHVPAVQPENGARPRFEVEIILLVGRTAGVDKVRLSLSSHR